MNRSRLLRTTAIRLALRYAVFNALLTGVGLGALYWATSRYVDAQIRAGLENELTTLTRIDQQQGRRRLLQILTKQPKFRSESRRYLLLTSPDGGKLAGDLKGWPAHLLPDNRVRNVWIEDDLIPRFAEDQDGFWPTIATTLSDGSRLLVAQSVRQAEALREFVLSAMVLILAVIVGLTLVLGWRMGQQMLERVDRINDTARHILRGNLASRVASTSQDNEFDELAAYLNQMLTHIEQLVNGMQEVTDNVAHDLRHPLSRLRNRLEVTLLETRDEEDYRQIMAQAVADIDGMIRTFNALLEIAQAEAGSYRGEWQEIEFSTLARDIGELYQAIAEENTQKLTIRVDPGISITGNRHLLGQAISNVLENAVKHSGPGSEITLSLSSDKGHLLLSVCDTGPGIPSTDHERVLKRFVRLDTARSTAGNGLGLSLVAAVVGLHGAKLKLEDNHPGLRVELVFDANQMHGGVLRTEPVTHSSAHQGTGRGVAPPMQSSAWAGQRQLDLERPDIPIHDNSNESTTASTSSNAHPPLHPLRGATAARDAFAVFPETCRKLGIDCYGCQALTLPFGNAVESVSYGVRADPVCSLKVARVSSLKTWPPGRLP